jgi:hypothetical protein
MPRTGRRFPAGVSIEIDDLQANYLPGDTITGRIMCESSPVADPARPYQVQLRLLGRAKSKYVIRSTNGTDINRGRASFFDVNVPLTPDPTPPSHKAWTFSSVLPTHPAPGMPQRGDEFRPHGSYLSTRDAQKQPIDVTRHPLPAVMYHFAQSELSGKTSEAYVEYFLQAKVATHEATLPLFLRDRSTATPITDFSLKSRTVPQQIKTPRLLAEHADTELTFRQKSSRFFKPSKTPKYSFNVKVEYPTILQLEHPDPLPLHIAVVPDLAPDKTSISPDGDLALLPVVSLSWIKLELVMQVDIRCPGTMYDHENDKVHTIAIPFRGGIEPVPIPAVPAELIESVMPAPDHNAAYRRYIAQQNNKRNDIPPISHHTSAPLSSTPPAPLHIGAHLAIFIGSSAITTQSHPPVSLKRQLYPTFATYNIRLSYKLHWRMGLSCAGESMEVGAQTPLTVLAASEQQEAIRKQELGSEGVKRNYDDLEDWGVQGLQFLGGVLSAVAG